MLNNMRRGKVFDRIPARYEARDPHDSYLLNLANFAGANYLVTGDKRSGLLELHRIGSTRILTATAFCNLLP